jgi:hypothetical protein
MFRETNQTASKIIELIQTLPEKEQKMIVRKLYEPAKKAKFKKAVSSDEKQQLKKIKNFQKYVGKHRFETPKGYKFDREEANAR